MGSKRELKVGANLLRKSYPIAFITMVIVIMASMLVLTESTNFILVKESKS
jgi:hypothetical protein